MSYTVEQIKEAATRCNWRHGYGEIETLKVWSNGSFTATVRRPGCGHTIRSGQIVGNEVRFAGTSAVIA